MVLSIVRDSKTFQFCECEHETPARIQGHGLCPGHYARFKRHGTAFDRGPLAPGLRRPKYDGLLCVGCGSPWLRARGLCPNCYESDRRKRLGPPVRTGQCSVVTPWGRCVQPVRTRKMCDAHYKRCLRTGDAHPMVPLKGQFLDCGFSGGCDRKFSAGIWDGAVYVPLCNAHFQQYRGGRLLAPLRNATTKTDPPKRHRHARHAPGWKEDVDVVTLGTRDRWKCGICHRRVDPALSFPHKMSKSIDHVLPLSRGGEHSYANTQLAHLRCNRSKNNRLGSGIQLRLVG